MLRREFKPGEKVILDEKYANSSIVEVVSQTPKKLYTMVKSETSEWEVMTIRLTSINK